MGGSVWAWECVCELAFGRLGRLTGSMHDSVEVLGEGTWANIGHWMGLPATAPGQSWPEQVPPPTSIRCATSFRSALYLKYAEKVGTGSQDVTLCGRGRGASVQSAARGG